MSLIDFIERAVRQIDQKQIQALDEFQQVFDSLQVNQDYNENIPLIEVSQSLNIPNHAESNLHDRANDESDYDEDVYSYTERNLPFFERIGKKNSRALDHFFKKLNNIKIETEPTLELTIKQTLKLSENPHEKPKVVLSQQKKAQMIPSLQNQNHKSVQYHRTIDVETPNRKRMHYIESLQMYRPNDTSRNPEEMQNNPEEKQKTASQILSELQQIHKQRSIERMQKPIGRSLNKRTRILKIGSEMQDMMREKKQKEAEQKIKVNIQFLQSLKLKPSKQQTSFKEFKNTPNQDTEKLKQSIRIKTIKKTGLTRNLFMDEPMTQDIKLSDAGFERVSLNNTNIFMDSRLRLPEIQVKKGALKPKPYSIYNVTQRGNEMFVHK